MNWDQLENDVGQMAQDFQSTSYHQPFLTVQRYQTIVVILLSVIAVCMVLLTIHFLKQPDREHSDFRRYDDDDSYDRRNSRAPAVQQTYTQQPRQTYTQPRKTGSVADRLFALNDQLRSGAITEEEFAVRKAQILNSDDSTD